MDSPLDAEKHGEPEDLFEGYFVAKALRVNFNYLFFPGLILHEFAHALACVLLGSKVFHVTYWSAKGGVVVHRRTRPLFSVIISLAPFFLNNAFAVLFLSLAATTPDPLSVIVFYWLAFSLAIYSLPSMHDLRSSMASLDHSLNLRRFGKGVINALLAVLWYPVVFVAYYLFLTPLLVFARNQTLRIVWFFVLYWAFATGWFG